MVGRICLSSAASSKSSVQRYSSRRSSGQARANSRILSGEILSHSVSSNCFSVRGALGCRSRNEMPLFVTAEQPSRFSTSNSLNRADDSSRTSNVSSTAKSIQQRENQLLRQRIRKQTRTNLEN